MKVTLLAAVTICTLLLTGYVTTKAGWLTSKEPMYSAPLKTLQVRSSAEVERIMNSEAGRHYRSGVNGNWKLAMMYR